MNFISTFDELNKLYEEVIPEIEKKTVEEEPIEEACNKEALNEAADDEEIEIVNDEESAEEIPVEEPVADDEPKQFVLECDKCGALVIKDEADIVADEESDLVNIEDECQFCEEAKGYKIIGTMLPYELAKNTEEADIVEVDTAVTEDEEL